jgi:hypothetical protein
MVRVYRSKSMWLGLAVAAALVFGICPAATAQSVRGHGELDNGPYLSPSQISVNASVDAAGIASGMMAWTGDINLGPPYPPGQGGPAEPFIVLVTDVQFDGNSALVSGFVFASPQGAFDGTFVSFVFTDNSGTGLPDTIDGQAIEAGNITIKD